MSHAASGVNAGHGGCVRTAKFCPGGLQPTASVSEQHEGLDDGGSGAE